jgi:hypothetical protein
MTDKGSYTCIDYREEMILLSLHRRLHQNNLTESEKEKLINEIKKIESLLQLRDSV